MHVVIIGNGVAGVTAARKLREFSEHTVTVVSDEAPYHVSRPAMMYVSLNQLTYDHIKPYPDEEWGRLGIALVHGRCVGIDAERKTCTLSSGSTIQADVVILATGASPKRLPTQIDSHRTVLTYSRLPDIEALKQAMKDCKRAAVVGGGLIGVEVVEILASHGIPTTWYIRESGVYASHLPHEESQLITDHARRHDITIHTNTTVTSDHVLGDADLVVVAIGMEPNISLAEHAGIACDSGILVDEVFATSNNGVYAIGDCAQLPWGNAQGWYVGREHGAQLAEILTGRSSAYQPSMYFNSAKFFGLEWQVYGDVPRDTQHSFFWLEKGAECCLRIAHNPEGVVIGVSSVGIRLRYQICYEWIEQRMHIDDVRKAIETAMFEPQLSSRRVI